MDSYSVPAWNYTGRVKFGYELTTNLGVLSWKYDLQFSTWDPPVD